MILSESTIIEVKDILLGFRGLRKELLTYEDKVFNKLFASTIYNQLYFPIDIIELSFILQENKILGASEKVYFSLDFAKTYFQTEYPLLLCFNKPVGVKQIGGIVIDNENKINVKDHLKRIYYVDTKLSDQKKEEIKLIINREKTNVDLCVLSGNSSTEKIATSLKKYVINIEQLGIVDDKRTAKNEIEALTSSINNKWQKICEQSECSNRPYKYRPETWIKLINSPMWRTIVREAAFNLSKRAAVVPIQIQLTPFEEQIFEIIINTRNSYPELNQVQLRACGGLVRDKIGGKDSDDIDVVVSHISGLDFARYVERYAKEHNISNVGEAYEVSLEKIADPKQAENQPDTLKVGGIKILGQKIEFIQLRKETYSPESRKPIVVPTNDVKEDVMRRDLKINALYYNLDTKKVEDFVGAMNDFERTPDGFFVPKKLSTPADPIKTFTEDPLRMLRVLRFFSKYPNVEIDPSILAIMKQSKDPDSAFSIAYSQKVHPSRVAKEIKKIMEGKNPVQAARFLFDTDFYKLVFRVPKEWHNIDLDQKSPYHNMTLKEHILGVMSNVAQITKNYDIPNEEKGLLILSAMLHDFGKMDPKIRKPKIDKTTGLPNESHYQYIGHEKSSTDFAGQIMTQMGFTPEDKRFVKSVISFHMFPHELEKPMRDESRKRHIGRFLRDVDNLWERIMYHGLADALSKENLPQEKEQQIRKHYENWIDKIRDYKNQMGNRISKPLLDGDEIREIVKQEAPELENANAFLSGKGFSKPVHYIKFVIEKLLEQQHTQDIITKEQAEQFIRSSLRTWLNVWKQQQKQSSTSSPVIKLSDASSGTDPSGFNPVEGQAPWQRIQGIYFGPKSVQLQFQEGDRVTTRHSPFSEGRIIEINNKEIIVKWDKGKYKGRITRFGTDNIAIWGSILDKI